MTRFLTAASLLALLAACDSAQPLNFNGEQEEEVEPTDTEEDVDPTDPNVDVNNIFNYDLERNLTLNAVTYDEDNDVVVINNLPFDGPSGGYDFVRDLGNGLRLYRSRTTATTGLLTYYAVFQSTDNMDVTAANGRDWGDFGYGGANVNRSASGIPDGSANPTAPTGSPDVGEYLYTGGYAGLRSFEGGAGIEIVDGSIQLLLDINDLDPDGVTQGSIAATIFDRISRDESGGFKNNLPPISLERLNFETADVIFREGIASTTFDGNERDTGNYEGLLAGADGQEIGGTLVIEGVANIQNVRYEIIEFTNNIGQTETVSALNDEASDQIQAIIDDGRAVATVTIDRSTLPAGATITDSYFTEAEFKTEFNAREIGAFATFQQ